MKSPVVMTMLMGTTLLVGCGERNDDARIETMQQAVSVMATRQAEIKAQVEFLARLVKETRETCLSSTAALTALEASIEATRTEAIEEERKRELREQLNRRLNLAENLNEHRQHTAAYRALKDLAEEYPDEPQGHRAQVMLIELGINPQEMTKSDEEVGRLLESNMQKRRAAQSLMEKARAMEQDGDMIGAVKAYVQVSREYPETEGARWVREMLAQHDLTDTSLNLLSEEKKREALRGFTITRKIDAAHGGQEHPNLATATQLLKIIREAPEDPQVERARRYFYQHGIVSGAEELAALTPGHLKETIGERIERIRAAEGLMHRARAHLDRGRFADAVVALQAVVADYPGVPVLREARDNLRDFGMEGVQVSDENRDEINDQVGAIVRRRREWERAERLMRGRQYFEAAKILRQFCTAVPDSPQARQAEEILGRWNIWNVKLDDGSRDEVNEAVAQAESVAREFERAQRLDHMGNTGRALHAFFEIARKYPQTPIGEEAGEWLLRYGIADDAEAITDADVAAATRRRAAREEHGRTHLLMRNDRYLEAIESFRAIAERYVDIPEGREAERILRGCGAWDVVVDRQNEAEIVAALRGLMDR